MQKKLTRQKFCVLKKFRGKIKILSNLSKISSSVREFRWKSAICVEKLQLLARFTFITHEKAAENCLETKLHLRSFIWKTQHVSPDSYEFLDWTDHFLFENLVIFWCLKMVINVKVWAWTILDNALMLIFLAVTNCNRNEKIKYKCLKKENWTISKIWHNKTHLFIYNFS